METVNQHIKPVYKHIARLLKMPEADAQKAYEAAARREAGDVESVNNIPKMEAKRSILGWSLMIVHAETPLLIIAGMVAVVLFFLEFLLQIKLSIISHFFN